MEVLALILGLAIGALVGTVGGGGAILALPVLVYVLGQGVSPSSTASLIVVTLGASVGAGAHALHGQLCWRVAAAFAAPAALGAYLGTVAGTSVTPRVLILAFVPVMLVAAGLTYFRLGLPIRRAIATSLAIIGLTGIAALTVHLARGAEPDWPLTIALCAGATIGALLGSSLGRRLSPRSLAHGFGIVVAAIAVFLLVDVVVLGGPPTG